VAVVPVAHNAGQLWPKNGFLKYPGTITVSIGAPIHPQAADTEALIGEVRAWIESEMTRIGSAR
jgi:1-acyl-sn-glycerol-3-phosphate acyltransferase